MTNILIADKPKPLAVHIRWMIRRDMPAVLGIEEARFEFPWDEEQFVRELLRRNVIAMVAECDERIVGFMVYELRKTHLTLLNLAVHASCERRGVGRSLVQKLAGKLAPGRRTSLRTVVRETNLDAHLFFRALGFRCVNTLREWFDNGEDGYEFRYRIGGAQCSEP